MESVESTDRRLVASARSGDAEAFAELYERHRDAVAAVCRTWLRDPHAAQDAVQEVFSRALVAISQVETGDRAEAWLTTIARNLCIDLLRQRRRRLETPAGRDLEVFAIAASDQTLAYDQSDYRQAAARVLGRLSRRQAYVLMAHHGYGMPLRELAARLHTTESVLAVTLHRARARARQVLSSPLGVLWPVGMARRFASWTTRHPEAGYAATTVGVVGAVAVVLALVVPATPGRANSQPPTDRETQAIATSSPTKPTRAAANKAHRTNPHAGEGLSRADREPGSAPRASRKPKERPPSSDVQIDLPLVDRRVHTGPPRAKPDYEYGARSPVGGEAWSMTVGDEPELDAVDDAACRVAQRGEPVTFCESDEP